MAIEVGAIVEGEVTGITKFGAFVALPENKTGLIHISEVSNAYVKDVHDFLKEHDKVKVKVVSVDAKGKINLSIKQSETPEEKKMESKTFRNQNEDGAVKRPFDNNPRPQAAKPMGPASFEDKLSKFLKDSDSRMLDLKRNTDCKRGGRGGRREK
ncbi:MAG: S1 RNA-binding domain-containing protein [Phascolarctobacterium sp.]|nr:S1 RNA-binding domain-containing protein [Phascolarctobacterium sp.]